MMKGGRAWTVGRSLVSLARTQDVNEVVTDIQVASEAPRPPGGTSRIGMMPSLIAPLDPALKARGLRGTPGHTEEV